MPTLFMRRRAGPLLFTTTDVDIPVIVDITKRRTPTHFREVET